jgi:predicted phosphodiesterase
MMKIAVCSDVHLEFGPLNLKNPGDVDVLILSGDICVAKDLMDSETTELVANGKSARYHEFFSNCAKEFPHVLYVVGNHEHYHGDFKYTISDLKNRLGYIKNLHILDKETFELDNVLFVGGTLWTDMNKESPSTMRIISSMMNDFRCVDNSNRMVTRKVYAEGSDEPIFKTRPGRFSPEDAVEDHKKMLEYIRIVYEGMSEDKQMVVVGHHTPSYESCPPEFQHDTEMNGGYHSDLTGFIMDHPRIKVWTHGHTHSAFDYIVGKTRVVCNPRGYTGYERIADTFELKIIDME